MMYDTPAHDDSRLLFVCFKPLSRTAVTTSVERRPCGIARMTIAARPGHSFDNDRAPRASEKDRRETKETGKERGNGLTRFTALD
jgi:hypothetical protein